MDTPLPPVSNLALLGPCDLVEARSRGHLHCRGLVETTAAAAGVVWVRDDATGNRMMLHTGVHDVVRLSSPFPGTGR